MNVRHWYLVCAASANVKRGFMFVLLETAQPCVTNHRTDRVIKWFTIGKKNTFATQHTNIYIYIKTDIRHCSITSYTIVYFIVRPQILYHTNTTAVMSLLCFVQCQNDVKCKIYTFSLPLKFFKGNLTKIQTLCQYMSYVDSKVYHISNIFMYFFCN